MSPPELWTGRQETQTCSCAFLQDASFVRFEVSVPRGISLGLYARRNALPTHTHYNLMEVVTGRLEQERQARAVQVPNSSSNRNKLSYLSRI